MRGWTSGDVRAGMCERGCFLTQCLQGSAQCFAGASGDVRAEMCERGCVLTQGLQCSAQCFAGANREQGSGTRKIMENFIERNDIRVTKKMELTSNEAVKQAILAGFGFSIMPLIGIKNKLLNNELHIIPLPGLPIISTWQIIWLKGKKHGPISLALIKHIEKEKEKIVNEVFSWHENY